jgi:beta-phosphoglucomutase-like phosphatase (HAD superfamily)
VYPPLIFDCDGVLVDSEAVYLTVELQALAALGVNYDRAAYIRTFMGLAPGRWRRELAADVRSRTGAPPPPEFFVDLDAALDRIEESADGVLAGVAVGMTVIGFTGGGHCVDGHADMLRAAGAAAVIGDFASLDAALGVVPR